MLGRGFAIAGLVGFLMLCQPARDAAAATFFSTGDPDGLMGSASRPPSPAGEIESADDFILTSPMAITGATFIGLLPVGVPLSDITEVKVEFYRVFPKDSDTTRTPNVPTRTNSPSDVALEELDSAAGELTHAEKVLSPDFTVDNTVINGINPSPTQTTGGEGPKTGQEVQFTVTFTNPVILPADHYFFIPQVLVLNGDFLWLSAPKPIVAPGTPFSPDLQTWVRNEDLQPDWLRIGTDIVGPPPTGGPAKAFNASFSLDGVVVPEPGTLLLFFGGVALVGAGARRRARR